MKFTIGKKITSGFALVIFFTFLLSIFTYYEVGNLNSTYQEVARSNLEKQSLVQSTAADIANEAVVMRRFNFTGDPEDISLFTAYRKQSNEKISTLENILKDDAGKQIIQTLKREKANYEVIAEKSMEAKKANNTEQVSIYMAQAGTPYKASMAAAQEGITILKEYIKAEEAKQNASARKTQLILLGVNILVTLLAIFVSLVLSRNLSRPAQTLTQAVGAIAGGDLSQNDITINQTDEIGQLAIAFTRMKTNLQSVIRSVASSSEQVAASSEELTASADQSALAANQVADSITTVAQSSVNQLKAVEKAVTYVDNIATDLKQATLAATAAAVKSEEAAEAAVAGAKAIDKTSSQMLSIQTTVNAAANIVEQLHERSNEISQITTAISGIAGQTNLLALNAAIEAARAGEQGRGFAVVAEEVRKLSEQSQEAAKQITAIITSIQADTAKAVAAMQKGTVETNSGAQVVHTAGVTFDQIEQLVIDVTMQVKQISTSIESTSEASSQVVSIIRDIEMISKHTTNQSQIVSAATQEQSASMQEIAASSQGLAKMAQELQEIVNKFRL